MFLECLGSLLFTLLQGLGLGMSVACGVWAVRRFGRGWKGALPPLAGALLGLLFQAAACRAGFFWASAAAASTGEIPLPWVLLWLLGLTAAAFLAVAAVGIFALSCLAAAGGRAEMAGQPPQSGKDPWWQGFFLTSKFIDIQYLYIVFQMR